MLYCLTHANVLSQSGVPDHLDRKRIGHYSTLPKALAARERAARLPGFSGFPAGFAVELIFCADGEEGAPPRLKRWRPAKSSSAWTAGRGALHLCISMTMNLPRFRHESAVYLSP